MRSFVLIAVALAFGAPATFAGLQVSEPTRLAGTHGSVDLLMLPGGALVAYGDSSGVHVREQARSGVWASSVSIAGSAPAAGSYIGRVVLADGAGRPGAVVWNEGVTPKLAPLPAGTPTETLPAGVSPLAARTLADGTVVTVVLTPDSPESMEYRTGLAAIERTPGGAYSTHVLSNNAGFVGLAQSGEKLVAVWTETAEDLTRLKAADRLAPGAWSEPVQVGDPRRSVTLSAEAAQRNDAAGNLTLVYNSNEPSSSTYTLPGQSAGPPIGNPSGSDTRVDVVRRPVGGVWQPVQSLAMGFRPSAAVSPAGTTAVTWFAGLSALHFAQAWPGTSFGSGTDPHLPGLINTLFLQIDDAGRAAYPEFTFDGQMPLYAGRLGCMSLAARVGDPQLRSYTYDFELRGDGSGLLIFGQSRPRTPPEGLYAVNVQPDGYGCQAPVPGPSVRPLLQSTPGTISSRALVRRGLRATVKLPVPARITAVLRGRRAGAAVQLASVRLDRPAGTHQLQLRVPQRRLQHAQPKLRLDVTLRDLGGVESTFRRTVRLKAARSD